MSKIKLFAVIFVAIIFVITIRNNQNLKSEIARVNNNNLQLMAENRQQTALILKQNEVGGKLLAERDSLSGALKIRPKQIEKIIYITTTEKDTVVKEVPVKVLGKDHWLIADTGKCYTWKGEAFLSDDSLSVKKTEFSYHNKTTQVFYKKRPHKFLFIRYGKWTYLQQLSSECGESQQRTIEFVK